MQNPAPRPALSNWLIVWLITLPFAGAAQTAQEDQGNQPAAESPVAAKLPKIRVAAPCDTYQYEGDIIDRVSNHLQKALCHTALWLDGITGRDGNILEARRTHGYLELTHLQSDYFGNATRIKLKVKTELPVLKRRLSAFAGLGDDEEIIKGREDNNFAQRNQFRNLQSDAKWLAGLGYSFPSSRFYRADFRVGIRGLSNPKLFVQNRYSLLAHSSDADVLSLRETLFWTNQEGLGATTDIDWTHSMSKLVLFRWNSYGTISEKADGLDWRSAMISYFNLQKGRGIAGELFVRGETEHEVPIREAGGNAFLRLPVSYDRLFLKLGAGYSWPRSLQSEPREGSLNLSAELELPFGF